MADLDILVSSGGKICYVVVEKLDGTKCFKGATAKDRPCKSILYYLDNEWIIQVYEKSGYTDILNLSSCKCPYRLIIKKGKDEDNGLNKKEDRSNYLKLLQSILRYFSTLTRNNTTIQKLDLWIENQLNSLETDVVFSEIESFQGKSIDDLVENIARKFCRN